MSPGSMRRNVLHFKQKRDPKSVVKKKTFIMAIPIKITRDKRKSRTGKVRTSWSWGCLVWLGWWWISDLEGHYRYSIKAVQLYPVNCSASHKLPSSRDWPDLWVAGDVRPLSAGVKVSSCIWQLWLQLVLARMFEILILNFPSFYCAILNVHV